MKENKTLISLSDKIRERVLSQVQPQVEELIKKAFAELEADWDKRERYIKEELLKKVIELFKEDSIYTGAVIEFEIRNNLGADLRPKTNMEIKNANIK